MWFARHHAVIRRGIRKSYLPDVLITVVGVPEVGMAGMNVLLVG